MYNRLEEWQKFSRQVELHILQYTLPQYGSEVGTEQVDGFTVEDCFTSMLRYINRRKVSVRGVTESLRDLIKVAHYAQLAYDKLKKNLGEEDLYNE
jgi:hypothetical protein